MTVILPETPAGFPERQHGRESCWTKEYLLRHCETYRVVGPDGPIGYVEEVRLSADGRTVKQLLVRRSHGGQKLVVPGELIEDIEPAAERLRIGEVRRDEPRRRRQAPARG